MSYQAITYHVLYWYVQRMNVFIIVHKPNSPLAGTATYLTPVHGFDGSGFGSSQQPNQKIVIELVCLYSKVDLTILCDNLKTL